MTNTERAQLQKDALWELHAAKQSVDEHQAKIVAIAKKFSDAVEMLNHLTGLQKYYHHGIDQKTVEALPSGPHVWSAISELNCEKKRFKDAHQQATRLNVKTGMWPPE